MALLKQLDFTFFCALLSGPGSMWKTLTCIGSGCLPLLVSRIWLALGKKKKVQWYHKNMWKYMSVFDFLLCCLAQHVFACLTVCCSAGRVTQTVSCSRALISSSLWAIRADIILETIAFTVKIPLCLSDNPHKGKQCCEVQLCTWTSKKSL